MLNNFILSLAIWTPIILGLTLIVSAKYIGDKFIKSLSLFAGLISFFVTLPLYKQFDLNSPHFQFQEFSHWIIPFNINYHLGVDGFSVPLILLTSFMTLIVIIFSNQSVKKNLLHYQSAFLVMSGLMIGVFSSLDAILYYVFWEAMLIPMFLIIGIWGGPNRIYATIKFFLYTVLGSLLMLVSFIYLYNATGGFSIYDFYDISL